MSCKELRRAGVLVRTDLVVAAESGNFTISILGHDQLKRGHDL